MSRFRVVVLATCLSAIATVATTAVAQERIELIRNFETGTVFQEFNIGFTRFGERGRQTRLPAALAAGFNWVPLAGGRYLVGINQTHAAALVVFDRRTRSIVATLPTSFSVASLIADPVRPRVFYSDGRRLIGFDALTQSSWIVKDVSPNGLIAIAYAHMVDRLYLLTGPNPFIEPNVPPVVMVVTPTSGSIVNQFTTTGFGPLVVDSNGKRLYKAVRALAGFTSEIAAYDPETGQEVARRESPGELALG